MTPAEIIDGAIEAAKTSSCGEAALLRHLAKSVLVARLDGSGNRVLDASDFSEWLGQLANEVERRAA